VGNATGVSSSSYENASGPSVVVAIGPARSALVILGAEIEIQSGQQAFMSFSASGSPEDDSRALMVSASSSSGSIQFRQQAGNVFFVTGLTAGNNTFQTKVKVSSGTATVSNRRITVIPF
jgi:hypothetical protein